MKEPTRITICSLLLGCGWVMGMQVWGQWHFPTIPGVLPNSAVNLGNNCFELTSGANTRGVVWDSNQIDLSFPFDITLTFSQQPWGADGLALVLQGSGLNSYGAGANALGFGDAIPAAPPYTAILPSIAFEVDTWDNSGSGVADIGPDHVAIHRNGNMAATIGGPVSALASNADITDGLCHVLRVTWNPGATRLQVFFDNNPAPRINIVYDMVTIAFAGNPMVWWGITGSSGGAAMTQTVCVGTNFADVGPDRSVCAGDTLHLLATGGTTYAWTPGPPVLNNAAIPNPIFGPVAAGTYTVWTQATNAAGCQDRDTTLITVDPVPVANPGAAATVCLGDSAQLGSPPSPRCAYEWTPNVALNDTSLPQPWVLPTTAGTVSYTLIVIDTLGLAGCRDTATVAVTALDTPSVALMAVNDTVCQGIPSTLTAMASNGTGPYGYAWSNGPTTASQSVTPSTTSAYTVTVTDAANCATVGNVTVVVNDTPTVSAAAAPNPICPGQTSYLSATASGGIGPYGYTWSSGGTTSTDSVAPASTTLYQVIATDSLGCQGNGSTTVTVNPADSLDILNPDTVVCTGGSVQIQMPYSSPGITTWSWSPTAGVSNPSSPNPLISPTASTTYFLSGTNPGSGCGYTDSIRIDYRNVSPPAVNLGPDTLLCQGDTLWLDAGNMGYNYLWLTGATSQVVAATLSGWCSVTVTDTAGCGFSAVDSLLLTVLPSPQPQLGADTSLCQGDSLQLSVAPTGNILWSTGSTGSMVWASQSGIYWVQVTNGFGCSGSDSLLLTVNPTPQPQLGADTTLCQGDSLQLSAPSTGSVLWSTGSTSSSIWVSQPGNHWVQVTAAAGCVGSDSLAVALQVPPQPQLQQDTVLCQGDSLLLTAATSGGTLQWSTGSNAPAIWVSQAGSYFVRETDSMGCTGTDNFILSLQPAPVVSMGALASQYCLTDPPTQLVGIPTGGNFSGAVNGTGLFDPNVAGGGNHTVTYSYTDLNGCSGTAQSSTTVALPPSPALAGPDQQVGGQTYLQAMPPTVGSGLWMASNFPGQILDPSNPHTLITYDGSGSYALVWTVSQPPCPAVRDTVWITFEGLHVPTGFSPNGDGLNDYYVIRGLGGYPGTKLRIFNRWGNLVWGSDDYQNDWNGHNSASQPLVEDTYYAVIEYGGKTLNTYVVLKR